MADPCFEKQKMSVILQPEVAHSQTTGGNTSDLLMSHSVDDIISCTMESWMFTTCTTQSIGGADEAHHHWGQF